MSGPGYPTQPQQESYPGYSAQGYQQPQQGYPGYPSQGYQQQPQAYPSQGYPQPEGAAQYPVPPSDAPGGYGSDQAVNMPEDEETFAFSDKSVRKSFIKKVYAILSLQLLVTGGIIGLFYIPEFRQWNYENPALFIAAAVLSFVFIIVLICIPGVRRRSPMNIIFLFLFTACEGVMLGATCAFYDGDAVLKAVITTVIMFLGLTLFAFQTKIDFTAMYGALSCILMGLICFGFMCLIFQSDTLDNVYAAVGAIVFGLYIIMDTQLLMGGKHKLQISPEEYIFAALNLYLDVINLFLFLLRLFGNN